MGPPLYRACGLGYIYLANGYRIERTPYGSGVSVDEIQSLHAAIAAHIVLHRRRLNSAEFRFLRFEMGMTQERIAAAFGVTVQTIARYEKGHTDISGPADRLMRILYVMQAVRKEDRLIWLEQIYRAMAGKAGAEGAVIFKLTSDGWVESE